MAHPLHLQLELDHPDEEPIEGRLTLGAGKTLPFVGYTELIAMLEQLRADGVAAPINRTRKDHS